MPEREGRKLRAVSWDCDGVLVERRIPIQFGATVSHVVDFFRGRDMPPIDAVTLVVSRDIEEKPLEGVWGKVSYWAHQRRKITDQVGNVLEAASDADHFINTGRRNTTPWVEMTWRKLQEAGIAGYFREAFFTPKGVSNTKSKIAVLRELAKLYGEENVWHVDDNERTVKAAARVFPNMHFIIVGRGLTSGMLFSKEEMKQFSHVTRVTTLGPGSQG